MSFTHLYFSKEKNGTERAITSLKIIQEQDDLPDSDPFLLGKNFLNKTSKEIDRDFGNDFSTNIIRGTIGSWLGPYESIYGSHLVKISKIIEARKPVYEEVKKGVLMDYLLEKKQQEIRNYIDELKEKYKVQINPKYNF